MKVKFGIFRILERLAQEKLHALRLALKVTIKILTCDKRGVQVDFVKLSMSVDVREHDGMSLEILNPPSFGPNVAGVEDGLALALHQEHDGTQTMVSIEQRDLHRSIRAQFNSGRDAQGDGLEEILQVTIMLQTGLKDTTSEIHAVGIFLNPQQELRSRSTSLTSCVHAYLACYGRAVHEGCLERLEATQMVGMHMAKKRRQRRLPVRISAKVIDWTINCERRCRTAYL